MEASALRRTSFVGSEVGDGRIGDDAAAYVSHLSPFLKGAEEFLKGAEADGILPAASAYAALICKFAQPVPVQFLTEI